MSDRRALGAPPAAGEPTRQVLDWGRRYSLWVFDLGLACCAVEFASALARGDLDAIGVDPHPAGPEQAEVLVVSGTLTDKLSPAVVAAYEAMPEPRYVVSFGSCANCGGPYWDSYSVTKGIDQLVPVDVYVPGCPPRPEALVQGLLVLERQIAAAGERP